MEPEVVTPTPEPVAPAEPVETPEPAAPSPETVAPDVRDRRAVIKNAVEQVKQGKKPEVVVSTNIAGRSIDPATGRFVAPKAAAAQAKASPDIPSGVSPTAPATAAAPEAVKLPGSLKAHLQGLWPQLSREWQEEIVRLDKTGAEAGQKFAPQLNAYKEIQGVIAPYENILRSTGRTPAQAIAGMMRAEAVMLTGSPQEKAELFRQFAQQYRVPLELVVPQAQTPTPDGQPQLPDISTHPILQELRGQVSQLSQHLTTQQQLQNRQAQEAAVKSVNTFMQEKSPDGTPKFPLDDSLQDAFAAEIGLIRQTNPDWDYRRTMEAAYDNLVWKTPELRALRLKKDETERRAREQQELAQKKAAAVQVTGAPGAARPQAVDPKDRRAFIAAEMAKRKSA